jgi:hypothetical protein
MKYFRDLFLGTLYATEHQKILGYVTNTKIKFIIIVDSSNTSLRYWYRSVLRIRDMVLFYPLDPGSGSGMNLFRIPDPRGIFWVRFS